MAELAPLARPYANAAFGLAKQENTLDQWSRMLRTITAATEHDRVRSFLHSPDLAAVAKAFQLAEVCGDELDDRGKKFLQVLADHDRLPLVHEILAQFEELRADEERSLEVEVISAYQMSDSQSEALRTSLHKKFDKEISIESRVDQSLIGGAIIRAGDTVIDGSVRGKLTKLAETLVQT